MRSIPGLQDLLNIQKLINVIHQIKKLKKGKTHGYHNRHRNTPDKNQNPFLIKPSSKAETEGNFLNMITIEKTPLLFISETPNVFPNDREQGK